MSALVFSQQHSAGINVVVMAYHAYVYAILTPMDEVQGVWVLWGSVGGAAGTLSSGAMACLMSLPYSGLGHVCGGYVPGWRLEREEVALMGRNFSFPPRVLCGLQQGVVLC
jgi:hypothetical protein